MERKETKRNGSRGLFCFLAFLAITALSVCIDFPREGLSGSLWAQGDAPVTEDKVEASGAAGKTPKPEIAGASADSDQDVPGEPDKKPGATNGSVTPSGKTPSRGGARVGDDTEQDVVVFMNESSTSTSGDSGDTDGLWKTTGVFLLGVGLSLLLLVSWRRHRAALGTGRTARNSMQVLGRVVLSPKHTACLLKVGPAKLVVVGLCGETMSPLCTIEGEEQISKFLEEDGEAGIGKIAAEKIEVTGKPLEDKPADSASFFSALKRALFSPPTGAER